MLSRRSALTIGMLVGAALVWLLWRSERPHTCAQEQRADALLGGGLPICLGQSPAQFAPHEARLRREGDDVHFPAGDLHFWYEVSGGVDLGIAHPGRRVSAGCVQVSRDYYTSVDSLAAFRRSLLKGDWVRMDSVTPSVTVTTWRRADGLQQTVSTSGIFCVRPAHDAR